VCNGDVIGYICQKIESSYLRVSIHLSLTSKFASTAHRRSVLMCMPPPQYNGRTALSRREVYFTLLWPWPLTSDLGNFSAVPSHVINTCGMSLKSSHLVKRNHVTRKIILTSWSRPWSLTLKTFSAVRIHMMNICARFYEKPCTK